MRSFFLSLAIILPLAAAATIPACSSSDDSDSTDNGGGTCSSSATCTGGQLCGYDISKGCSAIGKCVSPTALPFDACGCQGQPVSYVAGGYASAPVTSGLACKDAAPAEDSGPPGDDGGSADAADGTAPSEAGSEGGLDGSLDGSDANDGAPE